MRWPLGLLMVLTILAGCSQLSPNAPQPEPAAETRLQVMYGCPGTPASQGICFSTWDNAGKIVSLAGLAVDPQDPENLAVAITEANYSPFVPLVRAEPTNPGLDLQKPALLLSRDGGATWQKQEVPLASFHDGPLPVDALAQSYHTGVLFDRSGRLHVIGAATSFNEERTISHPAHQWSDDLGAHWTLSPDFTDKANGTMTWIVEDPSGLLVVGWEEDGSPGWAVSSDQGVTWERGGSDPELDCGQLTRPTLRGGVATMICWSDPFFQTASKTMVVELDLQARTVRGLQGVAEGTRDDEPCQSYDLVGQWPVLLRTGFSCGTHQWELAATHDGKTWQDIDLDSMLPEGTPPDWKVSGVGLAMDPLGRPHLLLCSPSLHRSQRPRPACHCPAVRHSGAPTSS